MRKIFFIIILIITTVTNAQNKPFSVTASYPLPVGDNFVSQLTGVADLGLRYHFVNDNTYNLV